MVILPSDIEDIIYNYYRQLKLNDVHNELINQFKKCCICKEKNYCIKRKCCYDCETSLCDKCYKIGDYFTYNYNIICYDCAYERDESEYISSYL